MGSNMPKKKPCSTSPADPALFPKIPIFLPREVRFAGHVVAIVAWPGPLLRRSLRESLWLLRANLARLFERVTWWNLLVFLGFGLGRVVRTGAERSAGRAPALNVDASAPP